MQITRKWLRERVRERLDEKIPGGWYTDEQINANLLIALFKVAGRSKSIPGIQKITTTSGQFQYPLSTKMFDGSNIVAVTWGSDEKKLDKVAFLKFIDMHDFTGAATSDPVEWSYFSRELWVWPKPITAEVITVRFFQTEPGWTKDTSNTDIPRELVDPLIHWAVALCLYADEEDERANIAVGLYNQDGRIMRELQTADDDELETVTDIGDD
jgi:hypothetical protein